MVARRELLRQVLKVESLRCYALAVGHDPDVDRAIPPLGHWAFFLPASQDDAIWEDGHPRRGGVLPAITLPRRMFAASDIRFAAPLLFGQAAEFTSTVVSVTPKSGRSVDLVFVEVDRVLAQEDVVRVASARPKSIAAPAGTIDGELWEPAPVNLFRFSAATFNGHRIHYDRDYAT